MDRKRKKLTPEKVIAELEQVKEDRARDNINFETEKCELESKIDKYKEQCIELQSENEKLQSENKKLQSENEKLQSENEKLQSENVKLHTENVKFKKYLQDLESANINVEEKNQITLTHNTDLDSQITKVNESNDDALGINSLPNEIILNIFGYLEQNQLGQIARVCKRWNVLTKSPDLWKKVNVKIFPSDRSNIIIVKPFINGLPSCVTSIRLDFTGYDSGTESLDFEEFCLKLQEKCPHLEELILIYCVLSNSLSSVIDLCNRFLQDVRNLIFYHSRFRAPRLRASHSTSEYFGISKIKILELNDCYLTPYNESPFLKLPQLEQLHLYRTQVADSWFLFGNASFLGQLHVVNVGHSNIKASIFRAMRLCFNLKELYACSGCVQDRNLNFNNKVFRHLKTICLSYTGVTCDGVVSLIQSCPSLENVYVSERVANAFAAHPFVVANRNKSGIVKAIGWDHHHDVDYSHN